MITDEQRVNVLVEEWKLLAGYVDRSFHSIEAQSLQIVLLVAAGIGAFANDIQLPHIARLFIAPAVFAIMLRMKSQAAFTFFQSSRITEIEDEINIILGTNCGHRIFYYAHKVAELSPKLGKNGILYPYPAWTLFLDVAGMVVLGYAAHMGATVLTDHFDLPALAWAFGGFFLTVEIWYAAATVVILYRFFKAVEHHNEVCILGNSAAVTDSAQENPK